MRFSKCHVHALAAAVPPAGFRLMNSRIISDIWPLFYPSILFIHVLAYSFIPPHPSASDRLDRVASFGHAHKDNSKECNDGHRKLYHQ